MNIKMDVNNSVSFKNNAFVKPAANNNTIKKDIILGPIKSPRNGLSIERSLSDALNIAQMSQNIIQRAIDISIRLKSLASEAITTGKINTPNLNDIMSDVKSTFGHYGEQLSNPVQTTAPSEVKIIEMPDFKKEITTLRDLAYNVHNGNYNQLEAISKLTNNLNQKLTIYNNSEQTITSLMRDAGAMGRMTMNNASELSSYIKTLIEKNPGFALATQGNINNTTVSKLIY